MKKASLLILGILAVLTAQAQDDVVLTQADGKCTVSNGLITMVIDANGTVTALTGHNGSTNYSIIRSNKENEKGYHNFITDSHSATKNSNISLIVAKNTSEMVELQYVNTAMPMNYTLGYIVRRGVSGVYNYLSVKCVNESDNGIHEARQGWRLNNSQMTYAYVSDVRQDTVPYPSELNAQSDTNPNGYVSSPQDATFELFDGRIYTKYDWANYTSEDEVHGMMGWTSNKYKTSYKMGAWVITPSYEWVASGVQKQELMVHQTETTPILLAHFESNHFGSVTTRFSQGQEKLYGPYLFYINHGDSQDVMIADAKTRAAVERAAWPYKWFDNDLYPKAAERATVTGKISLDAAFNTTKLQVVLAKPAVKPHLQGDGYMFWAETDSEGNFEIKNVRPGEYAVYAWALNGEATGTFESEAKTIAVGSNSVGELTWEPVKYAQTVWMIGESNRRADEFKWSDMPRTYGQWYQTPTALTYTIGESTPKDDWYYCQGVAGNWMIKFNLDKKPTQPMHLTIATAGAAGEVKLTVKCNNSSVLAIKTENDGSVYRSAMQSGRDSLFTCEIPVARLKAGENTIDLGAWNYGTNGLGGILYDCIKLEAEEQVTGIRKVQGSRFKVQDSEVYDLLGRRMSGENIPCGLYIRNGKKYVFK